MYRGPATWTGEAGKTTTLKGVPEPFIDSRDLRGQ